MTENKFDRSNTTVNVKELNLSGNAHTEVIDLRDKVIYNMDNKESISDWIRKDVKKLRAEDAPQLKSALNWLEEPSRGNLVPGSLGYLVDSGNNVNENTSRVFWLTCCRGAGHGISCLDVNFNECCSTFAARRLISGEYATWINSADEYMIPDISHPKYPEWQNDSIVYSLFNNKSNQSSLRNIYYNGKTWNIFNEFFFMSVDAIEKLADGSAARALNIPDFTNESVLDDIDKYGKDRYVYKRLKELKDNNLLSPEALAVLTRAENLVISSFRYRKDFNESNPEYHINSWDAGWYQIKGMLKKYDKAGLDEFTKLYKRLADKMRPMVYELGFLYK